MPGSVIELRGASVRAARGQVFGPLDAESNSQITVIVGMRGSGRTSLLLTLSGRMRLTEGSIEVLGDDPATRAGLARIRRRSGIAGFEAIDALEQSVTVGDTLRERLAWAMPWWRRTPRITAALAAELLAEAFGEYEQPKPETLVRDLDPATQMLLRIALARLESPELLCVDDLDALSGPAERALVAERLRSIAAGGMRIIVATSDFRDAELLSTTAIIEL